jgi:STE24 endopeptidase
VRVRGIYEIGLSKKTKKANAAVIGIGKSRRIILGDTLTAGFEDAEIEMVMAHEIGHHALGHVPKGLFFNTAISFGGFYLLFLLSGPLASFFGASGIDDLLLFPAVTLMGTLGGIALLPVQNGFSRFMEYEADRYAVNAIPDMPTFRSMMKKLGEKNLADPEPEAWVEFFLYTHPSIPNRIRRAEAILSR